MAAPRIKWRRRILPAALILLLLVLAGGFLLRPNRSEMSAEEKAAIGVLRSKGKVIHGRAHGILAAAVSIFTGFTPKPDIEFYQATIPKSEFTQSMVDNLVQITNLKVLCIHPLDKSSFESGDKGLTYVPLADAPEAVPRELTERLMKQFKGIHIRIGVLLDTEPADAASGTKERE